LVTFFDLYQMNKKEKKIKTNKKSEVKNMKYICDVCGWIYDEEKGAPELGIAPGTKFEDLPKEFVCDLCKVGKERFSEVSD